MKTSKKQLQQIIYRTLNLINEGVSEKQIKDLFDKVKDNPFWSDQSKEKVIIAFRKGINKLPQIKWLTNFFIQYPNNIEPIDDIIKSMKEFNRLNSTIRNLGLEADMTKYESPSDLRSSISRAQGKVSEADLTKEATHLGKFGMYNLWLPHTREASCTLGEGTSWCTAIPGKGSNLFYNYVARKNAAQKFGGDIDLFYLILDEKDPDSQNVPLEYTKMSLGYVDPPGEIQYAESYEQGGGTTVTYKNNGLTEKDAKGFLGSQLLAAEEAIEKYMEARKASGKQHPAKEKFKKLANNPIMLKRELQGSNIKTKEDTLEMVRDVHSVPPPTEQELRRYRIRTAEDMNWYDMPKYMPQYPDVIKEIVFKESQKIFYRRIAQIAKRAYEYHDTYSVNLMDFMAMIEHPEGDMFEERHASVRILEEIRKQELGVDQTELLMLKEYFEIIRKSGLELIDEKTGNVVQPEEVESKYGGTTWQINIDRADKQR